MSYKEINPNVWKYENEGDKVEGILVNKNEKVGPNESMTYHIETEEKEQLMVWGTAILDDRMKFVNVGDKVKITFKGTNPNKKGQPTKIFKVEVDKKGI